MKVYTYDPAPNPRRLALFMQLKGVEIETRQIDMMVQEQLSDEYRKINPACTLPALVLDDGTVLTEVIGMATYLEATYPDTPLLGTTALEKAEIISWDHRLFIGLTMAIASVLRNRGRSFTNRALPGPLDLPQIPELMVRGEMQVAHILPELDAHLQGREWLAADHFTFADITLLVAIDFLAWIKQEIPADCPNLQAWHERANAHVG